MGEALLDALVVALDREAEWQRREHASLIARSLAERVAVGVTWAPLQVETIEASGRGRSFLRLRTPKGSVLHDGIEAGDPVRVGPTSAPDAGPDGTVVALDARIVEIVVDDLFEHPGPLAVTRRFDPTTFERYRQALRRAAGKRTPLRDVLLGLREPGESPDPLPDSPRFAALNEPQQHAARLALGAAEVALIQGPPGTGKTTLLVALLGALSDRGDRPWALADSNAAVDHLAVRAAQAGLVVVRVGHPARIGSSAEPLSLDARVAAGPVGRLLKDMDRDLIRLRNEDGPKAFAARRALLADRERIEQDARRAVLEGAQVIACTLGTLARVARDLPAPITAVVDEATQAIEPATWSAVPYVERLVLVGDPCQLGPVVMEPGNPLSRSLLDRLLDTREAPGGRLPLPMLEVQHRMHADIEALVQPVYANRLQAHPSVAAHLLHDVATVRDPLFDRAVVFVDTAGAGFEEAVDPVTRSLFNDGEARLVAMAVARLREAGVPAADIGVIAPYSAQVARLGTLIDDVEIATVNAFQGREKEAIVVSFVRSNDAGDLGFVADGRRLTVALSRARRFLLCVGDSATLGHHPRFGALLDRCAATGALTSAWEPPWSDAGTDVA